MGRKLSIGVFVRGNINSYKISIYIIWVSAKDNTDFVIAHGTRSSCKFPYIFDVNSICRQGRIDVVKMEQNKTSTIYLCCLTRTFIS